MSRELQRIRTLCRELGGDRIDLWTLPERVAERRRTTGLRRGRPVPLREVVREVISEELVLAAQAGDPSGLDLLVELWYRDVLHWCKFNGGTGVNAEDAAHDVLTRLLKHVDKIRKPRSFRAWLWSMTWRVLREHERRPWIKRWLFGTDIDEPDERTPERRNLTCERARLVKEILEQMPLQQRQLLWLHYAEGLSRTEIAELQGMPRGTLNRRFTRARQDFAKRARRRGLGPEQAEQALVGAV